MRKPIYRGLRGVEAVSAQVIEGMDLAAARGIVPTSYSFDPVLTDARNVLKGAPFDGSAEDSAILADLRAKVDKLEIADAEKKRLLDAGIAALQGPFRRGFEASIARIESLRSRSPGPHGVWKLPDGDEFYRNQIDFWTSEPDRRPIRSTTSDLPRSRASAARWKSIMRKVGFKGDLPAFFKHLREDPAQFLPEYGGGAAGLSRPVEGLYRRGLLGCPRVLQRACRRRRSKCAASRPGARKRRRSRSTTSPRPMAAGPASIT